MEHQTEHRMEVRGSRDVSRIEVIDGSTDRRRWPDDLKAQIVAESFALGARVCDVAARYGVIARHPSSWRALARKGQMVLPGADMSAFVPLVVAAPEPPARLAVTPHSRKYHPERDEYLQAMRIPAR